MNVLWLSALLPISAELDHRQSVIVVVGACGAEEYRKPFDEWASRWQSAARQADAKYILIGHDSNEASDNRDRLQQQLAAELTASEDTLWLILIGHGTFDGHSAKFNLRGPDITANELAQWLAACKRPLAIVNCASASGPFINQLSGPNRIVVTSTNSGYEYNFSRFGDCFSSAINDQAADFDKDQQTSLLEAFLAASAKVEEFYAQQSRLATEHALIDDNGDAKGTPASWFRGIRATRSPQDGAAPDGLRANQFHLVRNFSEQKMPLEIRNRRDKLEREMVRLRQLKDKLGEDRYYGLLERVLVELAQLYQELERTSKEDPHATDATPEPNSNAAEETNENSPFR